MRSAPIPFAAFVSIALAFSSALLGCNEAKLTPAPDAAPPCAVPVLEYPCAALASGTPGCGSDLDAGGLFGRQVTLDGSFPSGCAVIVYDAVPDEQNQCTQLGSCRCGVSEAGAYGWTCVE